MVFVRDILTHLSVVKRIRKAYCPEETPQPETHIHKLCVLYYMNIHHADTYVRVGTE